MVGPASLLKWDGEKYSEKAFFLKELPFNGQVHYMWGKDENTIYLGSENNNSPLYYYYGNGWRTLDYGENRGRVTNISGFKDSKNGKYNVYMSMNYSDKDFYGKLFKIDSENKISEFPWREERRISGVWMKDERKIYACGGGTHVWNGEKWSEIKEVPLNYTNDIMGTDYNNIFVVGAFNLIAHFNGMTWKVLENNKNQHYNSIAIKNNTIAIVGSKNGNGIIKIAKF